ncbi:TRAP transporter small permease subunit [Geothermobacter hydrogeniphilus]|nr:TRAP transporter small permease [Geothermobacter hydrogeniphilus]
MIDRLLRWIDRCSRIGACLSALCMLLIVGLVATEVALRTLAGRSTLVADEYSGYLMVATVLFGLAYTLASDGHIRITILTGRLPEKPQRWFESLAALLALLLCLYLFRHACVMVYDTWSLGMTADSIAETPLWIPQLSLLAGLALLCLQLLAEMLRRLPFLPTR